jgi:hypothetical protein
MWLLLFSLMFLFASPNVSTSLSIPKNCLLSLRAAMVIDLVTVIVQTVHEMKVNAFFLYTTKLTQKDLQVPSILCSRQYIHESITIPTCLMELLFSIGIWINLSSYPSPCTLN